MLQIQTDKKSFSCKNWYKYTKQILINILAIFRTGKVKVPEHMDLVKTARFKELAPYDPDWFYVRCAAILRHIYIRSPVGVKTVTKIFGGRKRNGVTPSHFCR